MPAELALDKSGCFIDGRYYGQVTYDDMAYFAEMGLEIVNNSANEQIHIIMDVREVTYHPNNIAKVWKIASELTTHKKMGVYVVVGLDHPLTKFMIDLLSKLGRLDINRTSSHEEAIELINEFC